jgi:hypothetical protein
MHPRPVGLSTVDTIYYTNSHPTNPTQSEIRIMLKTVSSHLWENTLHIHHKDQQVHKTQSNNSCVFLSTRTNKSTAIFNVAAYGTHSYTWYEVCGSCFPQLGLMVHMVQSKGSTITQSPPNSKICCWYFNLYTVTAFWRTVTSHSPLQLGLVQRYTLSTFTRLTPACRATCRHNCGPPASLRFLPWNVSTFTAAFH